MNNHLSELLAYLRLHKQEDWNYKDRSPLNILPILWPETFSWSTEWQCYTIHEQLSQGVTPAEYVANFLGLTVSSWFYLTVELDENTTQEEFVKELEKLCKS